MTITSILPGMTGLALLNAGLGTVSATMGEGLSEACPRPSTCFIQGNGDEMGGALQVPLLTIPRPGRNADQQVREREIRTIALMRDELREALPLATGALVVFVKNAIENLTSEEMLAYNKVLFNGEPVQPMGRDQINSLMTDVRARKSRPEYRAYESALRRFSEASVLLSNLRAQLAQASGPFPREKLREMLDSIWRANETALSCDRDENASRQAVIDAWRER